MIHAEDLALYLPTCIFHLTVRYCFFGWRFCSQHCRHTLATIVPTLPVRHLVRTRTTAAAHVRAARWRHCRPPTSRTCCALSSRTTAATTPLVCWTPAAVYRLLPTTLTSVLGFFGPKPTLIWGRFQSRTALCRWRPHADLTDPSVGRTERPMTHCESTWLEHGFVDACLGYLGFTRDTRQWSWCAEQV